MVPGGVIERSHDLAVIIDPIGYRLLGTGHIDGREAATTVQEAVPSKGRIVEISHDLAAVVDPKGFGVLYGAGEIDSSECTIGIEEAMYAIVVAELAHNLAAVVESIGLRPRGTGHIYCDGVPAMIEETMKECVLILERSDNLAAIIDPSGRGSERGVTREIDGGEGAAGIQKRTAGEATVVS